MTSSPTASVAGHKRAHEPDDSHTDETSNHPTSPGQRGGTTSSASTSNFRNVSACNRCRLRKNRCDQRLPACTACEKVKHRCVGFDPITKQEIPRSYVYYLESRVSYFESLLVSNNIPFEGADAFDDGGTRGLETVHSARTVQGTKSALSSRPRPQQQAKKEESEKTRENERFNQIVDDIGMVTVQGASDRRYLGSTSGISFARVVLAAVKSSVAASNPHSERASTKASFPPQVADGGSSMRDSYFGLSTKPTIKEAPFPDRALGEKLVGLYFEHANPQIPILHREDFLNVFDHAYSVQSHERTPRELYLLNIVFAIGAGIIFGSSNTSGNDLDSSAVAAKRVRLSSMPQAQPEEYHASAIVHLSTFLSTSSATDGQEKSGGDLDDLQAVLLLAGFALLRPVAPGLWYIVGVAMRLAIDLGLHFEDGLGLGTSGQTAGSARHQRRPSSVPMSGKERGKREWMRDLRRRLWWCTYAFDRLVSTCVGRPFGVTDVVVTTEFPSMLDDKYITREGIKKPLSGDEPSYKAVAYHYLRLRLLQSEILQVLQYQQAHQARLRGVNRKNPYVHKHVPSPFLVRFADFRSWRNDVDQRLWEWKESAPTEIQTGVAFLIQFLELNYWQAVIMLYRNSLSVPDQFAHERSPTAEVSTPTSPPAEEEEQDLVFLKCAEAGQKTLKLYRQLHRRRLVNYTYLATHHLFMAGISFLYAVWHSPAVRQNLTLDDFDFTVLAATSVLGDLIEVCPPAEACRDAFERMSKATVQMCMSTPGFGFGPQEKSSYFPFPGTSPSSVSTALDLQGRHDSYRSPADTPPRRRPPPRFDMNLRDLFPDDLDNSTRPSTSIPQATINAQQAMFAQANQGGNASGMASRPQGQSGQNTTASGSHPTFGENFTSSPEQKQMSRMLAAQSLHPPSSQYVDINQNSYNADFMSNLPGLEFLNSLTRPAAISDPYGGNPLRTRSVTVNSAHADEPTPGSADHTFDGTTSDTIMDYGNFEFSPAFNFGDNMNFDFDQQHDWGNGQNGFDLFNGFFFDRNGS